MPLPLSCVTKIGVGQELVDSAISLSTTTFLWAYPACYLILLPAMFH